jgi:FtsZ-binding cell division protein ZapB
MTPEERQQIVKLKTDQDVLHDALGKIIKVVSDKIINLQYEITEIRGDNNIIQKRAEKASKRKLDQDNEE